MRTGVLIFSALCLLVAGCTASPPSQVDNICRIFEEKRSWHRDVKKSAQKWKSSVPIIMAIIYQESRFRADAKPPRRRILGFIPGPRPSDAYGYSQALEDTWNGYRRQTGQRGADRDKFKDAVDFIGWYNQGSVTRLGIARQDAYRLYLAYHEGWGDMQGELGRANLGCQKWHARWSSGPRPISASCATAPTRSGKNGAGFPFDTETVSLFPISCSFLQDGRVLIPCRWIVNADATVSDL